MTIALVIFGSLLAFAAIGSAISKLLRVPDVMVAMAKVGVKDKHVPLLALLEIAGGAGVIAGIWLPTLGLLASASLVLYFVGVLFAHFTRGHKPSDFGAALGIFLIATATTLLQLQR